MIVERLKQLRNDYQVSQKDFAEAIGVAQQTVASWEVGRTEPANIALKSIADYFHVTTDYLLGREDKDNSLSDMQSALLFKFDKLNDEGKHTLMNVLVGLNMSHSNKNPKKTLGVVQNNRIRNNYGVVGGNFNSTVNLR